MERVQECFATSYRRLVGQLYAVCGDLTEAEDVVAEAFVRAAANPRKFSRVDNPEAWLRTVAVNLARTRHRRRVLAAKLLRESVEEPRHPEISPDRVALVTALRALPASQRETLALHYLADLPLADVAATLGVAVGTVKARLSRGRVALARLLDAELDTTQEVRRG